MKIEKLILAILLIGIQPAALAVLSSPEEKRTAECAICHIDWLGEYKESKRTLMPLKKLITDKTGEQNAASTKRMCFSCHDGYINDSRFQYRQGVHEHPINIKPSKAIHLPKTKEGGDVYPLNKGKIYCGSCHTAHGNTWNKSESALFMRTKNINSSLCRDCHKKQSERSVNNHPMARHKGKLPAALETGHAKLGKGRKVICETCHRSHLTSSDTLLIAKNTDSRLCIGCHREKKSILKSKHDLSLNKKHIKNIKGHSAKLEGPCAACHVTHNGLGKPLLATTKDRNKNDLWYQCLSCHNKNGIAGKTSIGRHSHPVDVSLGNLGIQVKNGKWSLKGSKRPLDPLPLFDHRGELIKSGGRVQCPTCHDTHASKVKDTAFLRVKKGNPSQLCLNCHNRHRAMVNSKHNVLNLPINKLRRFTSHVDRKQGLCYVCHRTHTGNAPNMLNLDKRFIRGTGSLVGEYCIYCHNEKGAAPASLVGGHDHPMPRLSNGVSGIPLFNRDGSRVKHGGGRMDCASCHNLHIWDVSRPGLSRKASLGTAHSGNSFLRLSANGSAPLCSRCHKSQALVIGTDHDFRITAKRLKNNHKLTVGQTGVCGQCHMGHNNDLRKTLWSRVPGISEDVQSSLCRSCHTKNHPATRKSVPYGNHPSNVIMWSKPVRNIPGANGDVLPLYNVQGKRQKNFGIITCPSCHNPHQWDHSKQKKGPGIPIEGTSLTSFLRKTVVGNANCADCHGLDGLFRFQYFHSKSNTLNHPLYIDYKLK